MLVLSLLASFAMQIWLLSKLANKSDQAPDTDVGQSMLASFVGPKVRMKYSSLLLNLKEQQKSVRSPFTVSEYLLQFKSYNGLQKISFTVKCDRKSCQNRSKSIRFVTSCAGHVDVPKNLKVKYLSITVQSQVKLSDRK